MNDWTKYLRWQWMLYFGLIVGSIAAFSVFGYRVTCVMKNERLESWVSSYGGSVDFGGFDGIRIGGVWIDTGQFFQHPTGISMSASPAISDHELELLTQFPTVTVFDLPVSTVNDPLIDVLARCENIEILNLDNSAITDKSISALLRMKRLERLRINYTDGITQDGLRRLLAGHPALKFLAVDAETTGGLGIRDLAPINSRVNLQILP